MDHHGKKIIICNGSYAELPLIRAAHAMGLHVIVTGLHEDAIGNKEADEYYPVSYSDKEAMLELASRLKVDAICPGCHDFSAMTAAYVAEKLGLPGHDRLEPLQKIMHKDSLSQLASEYDLPVPGGWCFSSVDEAMTQAETFPYPVIVKPVDLAGGIGIRRIDRKEDLRPALEKVVEVSRQNRILIQEFVVPDSFHHNFVGFVADGKVVFWNTDNEHYSQVNPYQVGGMSIPSVEAPDIDSQMCAALNICVEKLGLKPGILMSQFCVSGGKVKIIEMGRRMPGNMHGKLIEMATGMKFCEWTIRAALGESCSEIVQEEPTGFWGEHGITPPGPGVVKDIVFDERIRNNIVERWVWGKAGTPIKNYLTDKLGLLLLRYSSKEEMLEKQEKMYSLVKVIMEDE